MSSSQDKDSVCISTNTTTHDIIMNKLSIDDTDNHIKIVKIVKFLFSNLEFKHLLQIMLTDTLKPIADENMEWMIRHLLMDSINDDINIIYNFNMLVKFVKFVFENSASRHLLKELLIHNSISELDNYMTTEMKQYIIEDNV